MITLESLLINSLLIPEVIFNVGEVVSVPGLGVLLKKRLIGQSCGNFAQEYLTSTINSTTVTSFEEQTLAQRA
jgi:hypothetical protein